MSATASPAVAGLTELMPKDQVLLRLSISLPHPLSEKNCSNSAGQEPGRKTSESGVYSIPTSLWVQQQASLGTISPVFPAKHKQAAM